jgi:hypothetical protein
VNRKAKDAYMNSLDVMYHLLISSILSPTFSVMACTVEIEVSNPAAIPLLILSHSLMFFTSPHFTLTSQIIFISIAMDFTLYLISKMRAKEI